jgi:beta-lactamase regulating signal transducer with metallopeptidase domain
VGGQIARLLWQRNRLARLLRETSPAGDELLAIVAGVAGRLQLAHPPQVRLAALDGSPFVCRMFRPLLVLPRELLSTLAAEELEQVLLHELAHVKRRDLVWGWLSEIARILYFFHPVAHWVAYRVRFERELACDQLALAASGRSPAQYADTLVRIVSSISRPSILRISAVAGLDGGVAFLPSPGNSANSSSE